MTLELTPLSDKQRRSIIESDAAINIWEGSVRSGKTIASLIRWIRHIKDGPAGDYMIVGKTTDALQRNIVGPMQQMLGYSECKYSSGFHKMHLWGKTVHVVGASDERADGKIQGVTLAGAYADEISLLSEAFFNMLTSRLTVRGSKLFGTTNPDSPYHWLKVKYLDVQKFRDDGFLKSWHFTLEDNDALDKNIVIRLKNQYSGLWYKRFIEGKWVLAEGTVYDFFDERVHTMELPPTSCRYYVCGVDYGTTNPCAFSLIGYDPSQYPNMWVEDEYYWNSREKNRQKTDSEYAEDLKKFIANKHIKAVIIDPSAASFKLECQRQEIPNIMDANNDVIDGIRYTSKMISNGTLKICKTCRNLIKEIQTYVWDDKSIKLGIDKPMKQNDHILDSLRYICFTYFKPIYEGSGEMDLETYRRWKAEQGWR